MTTLTQGAKLAARKRTKQLLHKEVQQEAVCHL